MSTLRARCPDCRTITAVAIDDEYQCHSCGREYAAGLVRVPRAWGAGGDAMAEAARLPLPYPEAAVIEEASLEDQIAAQIRNLPVRPLVLGGCCCSHVGAIRGLADRARRPARGRLDRCPRRPQHARQLALRQRVGDAVADGDRRRCRRSRRRRPRRRAEPRSARARVPRGDRDRRRPRPGARGVRPRVRRIRLRRAPARRARRLHAGAGRPDDAGGRGAAAGRRRARVRSPGSG